MVFSSAIFLFAFLPIVILMHTFITSIRIRNALLIVASLVFYSFGEPVYVLLLLLSIIVNFVAGRFLAVNKGKSGKIILAIVVVINLLLLVVFKYAGYLLECVNLLPFVSLPVPHIRMPIGISFFTFQALSYVIDTYKRESAKRSSFWEVCLYICLFPQLVAGPIVKYGSIKDAISDRKVTIEKLSEGIGYFIIGLSKKMLIANVCATAADKMFALELSNVNIAVAWVGAISYLFQIYFDFSGYSDMAVGIGKMLGFEFPQNFNYPYIAGTVRDFWKRWHISLTSWFREYLYFPLGGNRKGKIRTIFNRFFVFVCTGIWHGANFTFFLWGIYHGLLTAIETFVEDEKKLRKKDDSKNKSKVILQSFFMHVYTLLAVTVGFVMFRSDNVMQGLCFIKNMFSFTNFGNIGDSLGLTYALSVMSPLFIITLVIAIIASTPICKLIYKNRFIQLLQKVVLLLMYVLCIFEIAAGSYNPFIYFRF